MRNRSTMLVLSLVFTLLGFGLVTLLSSPSLMAGERDIRSLGESQPLQLTPVGTPGTAVVATLTRPPDTTNPIPDPSPDVSIPIAIAIAIAAFAAGMALGYVLGRNAQPPQAPPPIDRGPGQGPR